MTNIPKDVEKYLLSDETVGNQFDLKGQTVYASKNRLFLTRGNRVRDISYIHISSIELENRPSWGAIIFGGIILVNIFIPWTESTAMGRLLMSYGTFSAFFTGGSILFGIFLIGLGFKWKDHYIKLSVAGMSETLVLRGNKGNISALFRLVNERRLQVIPDQSRRTTT